MTEKEIMETIVGSSEREVPFLPRNVPRFEIFVTAVSNPLKTIPRINFLVQTLRLEMYEK